jgi:hypothetical protein
MTQPPCSAGAKQPGSSFSGQSSTTCLADKSDVTVMRRKRCPGMSNQYKRLSWGFQKGDSPNVSGFVVRHCHWGDKNSGVVNLGVVKIDMA